MRTLSAAVFAIALSVVACGGDDNAPTQSPSPSATASATASPLPTVSPTRAPSPTASPVPLPLLGDVDSDARIVYVADPSASAENGYARDIGELWLSDVAGAHVARLTPAGVQARFVGLIGDPTTGPGYAYYLSDISDDSVTINRIHFPVGSPEHVLTFTPWEGRFAGAALSPDQSSIAYTDRYGLQLLDLRTYHVTTLAHGGDHDACLNPMPGSIGACLAFSDPIWSPDGSRIVVHQTFYEGGQITIVDPSSPGAKPTDAGGCCGGEWSPDGDAICSWGGYDAPTGLYISRAPDWKTETYTGDFAVLYPASPTKGVDSCSWLDSGRLALGIYLSGSYPDPSYSYTTIFDVSSSQATDIGPLPIGELCCWRQDFAVRDAGLILGQYILQTADPNVSVPSQPEAIDITTGQAYSTLEEGDWIVAVVTP